LSNINFFKSPSGKRSAKFFFICNNSSFKPFALPCISGARAFNLILPFKYPRT